MLASWDDLYRFAAPILWAPRGALPLLLLALGLVWAGYPLRKRRLRARGMTFSPGHWVILSLLALWGVMLVYLTIDPVSSALNCLRHGWPLNPIPWFEGTVNWAFWLIPDNGWEWLMLAGNVGLFLPLGLLLPLGWRGWKVWKAALCGLGVSLAIELLQFTLAARALDVQDILTNTAGAALGGWLGCIFPRRWQVQPLG